MWSSINVVEVLMMNPKKLEQMKGFRAVRLEYSKKGEPYADEECMVYLPESVDLFKFEAWLNEQITEV